MTNSNILSCRKHGTKHASDILFRARPDESVLVKQAYFSKNCHTQLCHFDEHTWRGEGHSMKLHEKRGGGGGGGGGIEVLESRNYCVKCKEKVTGTT